MKNVLYIIAAILLFTSCKKDETEVNPVVNDYPLAIGDTWEYDVIVDGLIYDDHSSQVPTDTMYITRNYTETILADTILHDTLNVKIRQEMIDTVGAYTYLNTDNQGLKAYAHRFVSGKKSLPIAYFRGLNAAKIQPGNLFYYEPPLLIYQTPMQEGDHWVYVDNDFNRIEKTVVGKEQVIAAGRTFDCFKISLKYYMNDTIENTLTKTQWLASAGLIKETTTYNRIALSYASGEEAYMDGMEVKLLTNFDLNQRP